MTNSTLMTSSAAGYRLGVSSSTVRRMAESGELKFVQKLPGPNGAYLFERAEIERAAAADKATASP